MTGRIFYRVANIETNQGLWYDWDGEYTGLIHKEFDFCRNTNLPMPFDERLKGWLSATDKLEDLWMWFPKEDIYRLQSSGWYLYIYEAETWKDYENHQVIEQQTSTPILRIIINSDLEMDDMTAVIRPQRVAIKQ